MKHERCKTDVPRIADKRYLEGGNGTLRLVEQSRRRVHFGIQAAAQKTIVELGIGEFSSDGYVQSDTAVCSICCGACQVEEMIWGRGFRGVKNFRGVDLQNQRVLVKINPRTAVVVEGGVNILDPKFRDQPSGEVLLDIDGLTTIPPSPENIKAYFDLVDSFMRRSGGIYVHMLTFPASRIWSPKSCFLSTGEEGNITEVIRHIESIKDEGVYLLGENKLRIVIEEILPQATLDRVLEEGDLYYLLDNLDTVVRSYILDTQSIWEDDYYSAGVVSYMLYRDEERAKYLKFIKPWVDNLRIVDRNNPFQMVNAVYMICDSIAEYAGKVDQDLAKERINRGGRQLPKYPFGTADNLIVTSLFDALQFAAYKTIFEREFEIRGYQVECNVIDASTYEIESRGRVKCSERLKAGLRVGTFPTPITRSGVDRYADCKTWALGRVIHTRKRAEVSPVEQNARLVTFTVGRA